MRILFINRCYYPDVEATGQLLTQLCEDLSDRFDVRVIAGRPNQNSSNDSYRPIRNDERNGVRIRRVRNTRFQKASTLGRISNWLSFLWMAGWASLFGSRPDVVVVETDPPLLCLLGAILKKRFGCKLVVYLQDIYPDVAVAIGKLPDRWPTRLLRRLFFRTYRIADRVVVLSEDMKNTLVASGLDEGKIVTIPNWVDCSHVKPIKHNNPFREQHELLSEFVVMYSGNMGLCQCLDNVIAAAEILKSRKDIVFLMVGDGVSRQGLERNARERGLTNVRFLDHQPESHLSESLSAADLHLVPLDPRVSDCLMPSKLYGVLASGTPALVIATPECELSRIVVDEGAGYAVSPHAPQALANQISELADRPADLEENGLRARQLAVERFDRRISVAAFASLLFDVLDVPESQRRPLRDEHEGAKATAVVEETFGVEHVTPPSAATK